MHVLRSSCIALLLLLGNNICNSTVADLIVLRLLVSLERCLFYQLSPCSMTICFLVHSLLCDRSFLYSISKKIKWCDELTSRLVVQCWPLLQVQHSMRISLLMWYLSGRVFLFRLWCIWFYPTTSEHHRLVWALVWIAR